MSETKRIYLSSPTMSGSEMKYIEEAFATNWVAPLGKNVDEFEKEMGAYVGVSHAVALSSGTAALHLAVKLANVRRGDVVLCSDLTFSASANPISYEGGVQVFIDSEYETWNMDPEALQEAFEKYPQAKAVVAVNLYGTPAKLAQIEDICKKHGVPLIEDAAESLGSTYMGRQTGSFGDYGVFSFNGNKIITTSGGGMLVSDDAEAIIRARFWATQAREPFPWYEHKELGYNYRMSNVVAGIGRGQLLHLDEHKAKKKLIYERYKSAFSGLPLSMNPYLCVSEPNFWLSCVLMDESCSAKPMDIINMLGKNNIEARPIWKPMHLQPLYKDNDFISVNGDVSGEIFKRGLCLPSDIKMTDSEAAKVINLVRSNF